MECCTAVTAKGKRCTRKPVNGDMCTQHSKAVKKQEATGETITITFGNAAENNVRQQILEGDNTMEPITVNDLHMIQRNYEDNGYETELINLALPSLPADEAAVLVVRNYAKNHVELYNELASLEWDSKYFSDKHYKEGEHDGVVNKHARHNLCFGYHSQEPNYRNRMGRIVPWRNVPLLSGVADDIEANIREGCVAEGNYYYDIAKCGIGYHGDGERKVVIGLRLGMTMKLSFLWFYKKQPVGAPIELMLNGGDLYIMSEKAVGSDWKRSTLYTLRHAAGCDKYTTYRPKKQKQEEEK